MRLSEARRLQLLSFASSVIASRPYDLMVGTHMERWMLYPRNSFGNVYIHRFVDDDRDEALHDHEPDNITLLLDGKYREHFHVKPLEQEMVNGKRRWRTRSVVREAGDVVFRLAGTPHCTSMVDGPAVSMFIMGPRRRKWGFHCVNGWVPWDEYINPAEGYGSRGKGCPQ